MAVPLIPGELAHFPTISMTTAGDNIRGTSASGTARPISVVHTPRLMTDSFEALRVAALAGVGVRLRAAARRSGSVSSRANLRELLPEFGLPPGVFHAVFPSRRGMVSAVRALIDALAEGFANLEGAV